MRDEGGTHTIDDMFARFEKKTEEMKERIKKLQVLYINSIDEYPVSERTGEQNTEEEK